MEENKKLEEEWLSEQKRLAIMMEIERLKGLKADREKEERKAIATKKAAMELVE